MRYVVSKRFSVDTRRDKGEGWMRKAGGIVGVVGGVFGFIAAVIVAIVGGVLGAAFETGAASTVAALAWGGVLFSLLAIVFGTVAVRRPRRGGMGLIIASAAGMVMSGKLVAMCLLVSLVGGILAVFAAPKIRPVDR